MISFRFCKSLAVRCRSLSCFFSLEKSVDMSEMYRLIRSGDWTRRDRAAVCLIWSWLISWLVLLYTRSARRLYYKWHQPRECTYSLLYECRTLPLGLVKFQDEPRLLILEFAQLFSQSIIDPFGLFSPWPVFRALSPGMR